ncbi:hypothetical protein AVEN_256756-1, partial [Araneus ventricosus]
MSPSFPHFSTTPPGHLTHVRLNVLQANKHGGSSVESGFEPGNLSLRSRDLTTRPLWSVLAKSFIHVSLLSVHHKNSAHQVASLKAVAIATGDVREDPFRIRGGIRWKSGFYFILYASLRR